MAIRAEFYAGNLSITDGVATVTAHFKNVDPDLPNMDLGTTTLTESDPAKMVAIMGFVALQLPEYAAKLDPSGKVEVVIPALKGPDASVEDAGV